MVIYPLVAALYFAVCWPLSHLARNLERRIDADLGVRRHL
jgi:polar amino acid transport system permease protein